MKAIVQEAIAKHQENQTLVEGNKPTAPAYANPDDAELAKLAETLRVNIRIVGCGGGGSNTINRCMEEGIQGAEMCALNTDARHLLMIHASRKVLIGRRTTKGLGAGARAEVG
ncbi:MAG: cell division protein FtsZ, partial [Thermoplasmata archaeon]